MTLGQDNEYIYRDLLGLRADDYDRLCRSGAVGTTYHVTPEGAS